MLQNICLLFISWISADPDIKNSKICLPIMQGANLFLLSEKSPKGNTLFLKEILVTYILFSKKDSQKKIHIFIFK